MKVGTTDDSHESGSQFLKDIYSSLKSQLAEVEELSVTYWQLVSSEQKQQGLKQLRDAEKRMKELLNKAEEQIKNLEYEVNMVVSHSN